MNIELDCPDCRDTIQFRATSGLPARRAFGRCQRCGTAFHLSGGSVNKVGAVGKGVAEGATPGPGWSFVDLVQRARQLSTSDGRLP